MKTTIEIWNTGRLYQRDGQVIGAKQVEGGVVFSDVSRMVDGFVKVDAQIIEEDGLRAVVMRAYDHEGYENAWKHRAVVSEINQAVFNQRR